VLVGHAVAVLWLRRLRGFGAEMSVPFRWRETEIKRKEQRNE
jgi:hypothetical protein